MSAVALAYHFIHAKFHVLFAASPEIWNYPFLFRFAYLILATELSFEHYYFGWSFAEGACVLTGLAYNGRDDKGNVLWNRVDMVDLWALSKRTLICHHLLFTHSISFLRNGAKWRRRGEGLECFGSALVALHCLHAAMRS